MENLASASAANAAAFVPAVSVLNPFSFMMVVMSARRTLPTSSIEWRSCISVVTPVAFIA
jgi:hypothetical protein